MKTNGTRLVALCAIHLALAAATSPAIAAPPAEAVRRLAVFDQNPAPIGKGYPEIIGDSEGKLLYSHYDETGNAKSIEELDLAAGKVRTIVSAKRDPRLIAANAQYVVLQVAGHPPSLPTEVIERATGRVLGRLRLAEGVRGAFIEGQHLLLLQGSAGYGDAATLRFTRLRLPDLKLLGETTVAGAGLVSTASGMLTVTVYGRRGRETVPELIFYDRAFRELGRVEVPRATQDRNSRCPPANVSVDGNLGVFVANCGDIHVMDMRSFQVLRTIPAYSNFYSLQLRNGLIYTTSQSESGIVIFDAATGLELGRAPIPATSIHAERDRLLAVGQYSYFDKAWPMAAYAIDDRAIKDGTWRTQALRTKCAEAQRGLAQGSLYDAIELCRDNGMDALMKGNAPIPAELTAVATDYASWLARSLHEYKLGLEGLKKLGATGSRTGDVQEATLKAAVLDQGSAIPRESMRISGDFSKALSVGLRRVPRQQLVLPFQGPLEEVRFFDDYAYEGRRSCEGEAEDGVYVDVYDRKTFQLVRALRLLPCDEEREDTVSAIKADGRNLYVHTRVESRAENRNDYFVYRKADWAQLEAKVYSDKDEPFPPKSVLRVSDGSSPPLETKGFIVDQQFRPPRTVYAFFRKDDVSRSVPASRFVVEGAFVSVGTVLAIPGSDRVISTGHPDEMGRHRIVCFDPATGKSTTFAILSKVTAHAVAGSNLYLTDGQNVFVFDLERLALKEVWPRTVRDNWGMLGRTIDELHAQGGDLILRTSEGTSYIFAVSDKP